MPRKKNQPAPVVMMDVYEGTPVFLFAPGYKRSKKYPATSTLAKTEDQAMADMISECAKQYPQSKVGRWEIRDLKVIGHTG